MPIVRYSILCKGVREECPDARIVLHLDFGTDNKMYRQWFDQDQKNETDFGKVSEKSRTSWKRTVRWEINMKPVTCELERHN